MTFMPCHCFRDFRILKYKRAITAHLKQLRR